VQTREVRSAAQILGVHLHVLNASTEQDFDKVFARLTELRAGGLVIGGDAFFTRHVKQPCRADGPTRGARDLPVSRVRRGRRFDELFFRGCAARLQWSALASSCSENTCVIMPTALRQNGDPGTCTFFVLLVIIGAAYTECALTWPARMMDKHRRRPSRGRERRLGPMHGCCRRRPSVFDNHRYCRSGRRDRPRRLERFPGVRRQAGQVGAQDACASSLGAVAAASRTQAAPRPTVHVRPYSKAGLMTASDQCSLGKKTLDVGGPPHMRLCLLINSARHHVNDRQ
jgi:hypothetical protein